MRSIGALHYGIFREHGANLIYGVAARKISTTVDTGSRTVTV